MKKILFTLILLLLFLPTVAVAPPMPCPISGKVITVPADRADGLRVKLTHKNLVWTTTTAYGGEFVFDVGGDTPCWGGMDFTLRIIDCVEPTCTKDVVWQEPGLRDITFDLAHIVVTTRPKPPTTTMPVTTTMPCLTESECRELCDAWIVCPECPEDLEFLITAVISAIVGGFFVYVSKGKIRLSKKGLENLIQAMPKGCGIRLFHSWIGTSDLKHIHRSPKTYHSLDKRHRGKYDHKGEENLFPDFGE